MSSIQLVLLILFILPLALKIDLSYSIRIRKRISSNFYPMGIIIRNKKKRNVFFLKKENKFINKMCFIILK